MAVALSFACASTPAGGDDWATQYVGSPDRVWAAIQLSLDELGYSIEDENRPDGRLRAVSTPSQQEAVVVLRIDQIMRSNIVKVYVKVNNDPSDPQLDLEQREAAAREFLAELNGRLYG